MSTLTKRFAISPNTVAFCEAHGLYRGDDADYTDDEIRRFGLVHTLLEADFPEQVLARYLALMNAGEWGCLERKRLLRQQRAALLDTIRKKEKSLFQLDYMIHEQESQKQNNCRRKLS